MVPIRFWLCQFSPFIPIILNWVPLLSKIGKIYPTTNENLFSRLMLLTWIFFHIILLLKYSMTKKYILINALYFFESITEVLNQIYCIHLPSPSNPHPVFSFSSELGLVPTLTSHLTKIGMQRQPKQKMDRDAINEIKIFNSILLLFKPNCLLMWCY